MKVLLQSTVKPASSSGNRLLLSATSTDSDVIPVITTPQIDTRINNKNSVFTPDSIPNFLIYGVSGLLLVLLGTALICAKEGRYALARAQMEVYKIPKELQSTILDSMDGIFDPKSTGTYINAGIRSYFNKLTENMVMKNKDYLYKRYRVN